jgi:hypothetical protein
MDGSKVKTTGYLKVEMSVSLKVDVKAVMMAVMMDKLLEQPREPRKVLMKGLSWVNRTEMTKVLLMAHKLVKRSAAMKELNLVLMKA